METINSLLKQKKSLKNYAEQNGKTLVYNRSVGGYQITSGFESSAANLKEKLK